MSTSTMNDLHDKSMDIVPKKRNDNSILEQLEEVKKKKLNDYHAFKLCKSDKTISKETCETMTIQGQYPSNTTVTASDTIINGNHEERLSGKYGVVKVRNFPGATIEDMQHIIFSTPRIRSDKANVQASVT